MPGSVAKPVHTSKSSLDFLPHSTLHWRGTGAWYHLVSLWRSAVVLSKLVLLLGATRERADTTSPLFASAQEPKVSKMRQLILHTSSNVQCSMCRARSKSARIVSHQLDQTDAAQGGDGPRCPVGRLLRQGGEASIPHSLQKFFARKFHKESSTSQARRAFHKSLRAAL